MCRSAVPGSRHGPNKLSNRSEIHYDSPHLDWHRSHHHVHRYDTFANDTEGVAEDLDDEKRLTLGEVLLELRDWYVANYEGSPRRVECLAQERGGESRDGREFGQRLRLQPTADFSPFIKCTDHCRLSLDGRKPDLQLGEANCREVGNRRLRMRSRKLARGGAQPHSVHEETRIHSLNSRA